MKKIITTILILTLLILTLVACTKKPGDTTVSMGRFYDDTNQESQKVSITTLADSDIETSGDTPYVSMDYPGFNFECQGLEPNNTLFVFIDGNIDNLAGEYDVNSDTLSGQIMLKEGSPKSEGEHTVQFVQFDKSTPSFCVTKHYIVIRNKK